jgi:hypothetical protein
MSDSLIKELKLMWLNDLLNTLRAKEYELLDKKLVAAIEETT